MLLITMEVIDEKDRIIVPSCGLKNLKPSLIETIIYTPFRDFNIWDFVFMKPHDPETCSYVDGKSIEWCCQGWPKWIFKNVRGSMVDSNEEKILNTREWNLYEDC